MATQASFQTPATYTIVLSVSFEYLFFAFTYGIKILCFRDFFLLIEKQKLKMIE